MPGVCGGLGLAGEGVWLGGCWATCWCGCVCGPMY